MNDEVKLYSSSTLVSAATVLTGATLISGGNDSMVVSSGGTANNTTMNPNTTAFIYRGGSANQIAVNAGCLLHVHDATATNIVWTPGVGQIRFKGGLHPQITFANSYSGCYLGDDQQLVSSASLLHGLAVSDSDGLYVCNGGTATNMVAQSGGLIYVFSGGMADCTLLNDGGDMYVFSGGSVNSTVLKTSGEGSWNNRLVVYSGGTATNIIASSGTDLRLTVAPDTYIQGTSAGVPLEIKNGSMTDYTIDDGYLYVYGGGVADNIKIKNNGELIIYSHGTVTNTVIDGGLMAISSGGIAKDTSFKSAEYGWLEILSGGMISGFLQISSGAMVSAYSGAVIDFTVAEQTFPAIALINDWSLISGGADATYTITVKAGQETGNYFLAQGAENFNNTVTVKTTDGTTLGILSAGGSSFFCNSNTYSLVNRAGNLGLQIASAGSVISGYSSVNSGETLNNATIIDGGYLTVSSGGTATGITVEKGSAVIRNGGELTDVQILSGATVTFTGEYGDNGKIPGEMESAIVRGVLFATSSKYAPATVRSSTVLSGGSVIIDEKCSAAQNILSAGGAMTIRDQALAEDTQVTGGTLYVLQGGKATGSEISDKGKLMLSGEALDTTVSTDGALFVLGGSVAEDISVDGGSVFVATGGEVKGDISISQSGGLYLYGGSIVEGDIHVKGTLYVDETMVNNGKITLNLAKGENVMIQNLDYLLGTDMFTVETGDVGDGVYTLADGAAEFDGMIAVMNKGSELGTLAIGETKDFGGVNYSLARNNDELEIRLGAVVKIPAKSDIDDSGISDVMFQYTGGDYQIGFWMNGTNTWQGQGISQPSNWELLGAYDMDQNGKADIVMRGNIQIGTDKGAYIGYYKDGDVTQWQNISFLNNPDDIDWRLAIGNVTGNEGCNSIVWHAPELGALGVWTDGTSSWVSLAGGFDSNWTMLGCGDFDGNGKDEVLFSNSGNLYTTDIDQKFASLGGWGNDWEVKTIGDFSGDGQDDIILQNGNMVVKFENGLAENWSSIGVMDANDWFIVGAGDYNGDFEDDLLVRQYSTGMLGYYESGDMSKWVELGRGVDMNWTVIA